MTLIAALTRAYETIPDLPRLGFVEQKISYVLRINSDGVPTGIPDDIRSHASKKSVTPTILVPRAPGVTVTSGIHADFLWGKPGYVLGMRPIIDLEDEDAREKAQAKANSKTDRQHAAFKARNLALLTDASHPALVAFTKFLTSWNPATLPDLGWPDDMRDGALMIAFDDASTSTVLFDVPEAKAIWEKNCAPSDASQGVCLVTGTVGPVTRLHPTIKGVKGAQSSGAQLASYDKDAFRSYGWTQGSNANVSVAAAFKYGQALNHFLTYESGHKFQLGDATVVFWAEGPNADQSDVALEIFGQLIRPFDQKAASSRVASILSKLATGARLQEFEPTLATDVKFHIAGLAPNASRIMTRFFLSDSFGEILNNYTRFLEDMTVNDKRPKDTIQRYLRETAALGDDKRVHPSLAGHWMRSILTGADYPSTLGPAVLTRIKADGDVNLHRVQILKALLVRNFRKAVPMAFDPNFTNRGYILGRLFSAYEQAQRRAMPSAKATIKEKFFASAATSPRRVFPALARGVENHLTKIRRQNGDNLKVFFQRMIEDIAGRLDPLNDPFPNRLSPEEQSLFALGYYHQNAFRKEATTSNEPSTDGNISEKE
jgi:CRISPR-associated protein Csd1